MVVYHWITCSPRLTFTWHRLTCRGVIDAFQSYLEYGHRMIDGAKRALATSVCAEMPELIFRLDAQRTAMTQNGAFLDGMLEELGLVHEEEPELRSSTSTDEANDSLMIAVTAVRSLRPLATAKEVHNLLTQQPAWSEVPLSASNERAPKLQKHPPPSS